jgi:hypothetical protein
MDINDDPDVKDDEEKHPTKSIGNVKNVPRNAPDVET